MVGYGRFRVGVLVVLALAVVFSCGSGWVMDNL